MTLAYSRSPANVLAPFEYSALLLAIFWGAVLLNDLPDALSAIGIMMIVGSGLIVALREFRIGGRSSIKQSIERR